jgi:hypothetical protein
MLLLKHILVDFSCVVFLSIVHFGKIVKYVPFCRPVIINLKHSGCCFRVNQITVFRFCDFLTLLAIKATKVFVVDIFDVEPLYAKKSLEFHRLIFPPKGKCFLIVTRDEPSNSLEHTRLNDAEK